MWKPVLNKADFTTRYLAGEYGNASPTWLTLESFIDRATRVSVWEGLYHLRNRVAGGETFYNLTAYQLARKWNHVPEPSNWYASEMVPQDVLDTMLIQGEVQQTFPGSGRCGLDLYYTQVKKPMREALTENSKQVSGIIALEILRHYMCPNSFEWLQELLRRYDYHVVEFSTYSKKWGTLFPKFNTIFWECRLY